MMFVFHGRIPLHSSFNILSVLYWRPVLATLNSRELLAIIKVKLAISEFITNRAAAHVPKVLVYLVNWKNSRGDFLSR